MFVQIIVDEDKEFNYFAEIIYDGVTYLAFEEGLKNIVDLMESNKSLF